MSTPARRRHLPSSPFRPDPELVIEEFTVGDLVNHDAYGMGRVTHVDANAVTVDFGQQTVRVKSPFAKMTAI